MIDKLKYELFDSIGYACGCILTCRNEYTVTGGADVSG